MVLGFVQASLLNAFGELQARLLIVAFLTGILRL